MTSVLSSSASVNPGVSAVVSAVVPQSRLEADHWHIFCRVIDNFGDIGVCWRLAQQLAREHSQLVTLWVDDLHSFAALCPALKPDLAWQAVTVDAALADTPMVQVGHWSEPFQWPAQHNLVAGSVDVVIEAFACHLPEPVLAAMQGMMAAGHAPLWINLEYLSAEDWVPGFHLSPSPVNGMLKYFFFPGFEAGTGGLLFDPGLLQRGEHMQNPQARWAFLQTLGLDSSLLDYDLQISLFAYENPAIAGLLEVLAQYHQPVHLLVPAGRASADVERWLGEPLVAGQTRLRGMLAVSAIPFLSQPDYDNLLAYCDLNLVRGEESFVRAQMIGKPFLWHIYCQEDNVHLEKLAEFQALYLQALYGQDGRTSRPGHNRLGAQANVDRLLAERLTLITRIWNADAQVAGQTPDWDGLLGQLPRWQEHARHWQQHCLTLGDVARNLVKFRENTRENTL